MRNERDTTNSETHTKRFHDISRGSILLNLRAHHGFDVGDIVRNDIAGGKFFAIHTHPKSSAYELHIVSEMMVIDPDAIRLPTEINGVSIVYTRRDDYNPRIIKK